jgi:hypothetical protein
MLSSLEIKQHPFYYAVLLYQTPSHPLILQTPKQVSFLVIVTLVAAERAVLGWCWAFRVSATRMAAARVTRHSRILLMSWICVEAISCEYGEYVIVFW